MNTFTDQDIASKNFSVPTTSYSIAKNKVVSSSFVNVRRKIYSKYIICESHCVAVTFVTSYILSNPVIDISTVCITLPLNNDTVVETLTAQNNSVRPHSHFWV